jgi:hypothetical protein
MKIGHERVSAAKEIIRAAEKFIQAQQYDLALKELVTAQRIDPSNAYIGAIAERIHHLIVDGQKSSRFLSVTVGDEFEHGIKSVEDAPSQSVEAQVRQLTATASSLLRKGAYETAFESLFDAYLLAPCSPTVIESERTLLPAIEMMRRRVTQLPSSERRTILPPSSKRTVAASVSTTNSQENTRLQELVRRKDEERLQHERAMWRDASAPPRIIDLTQPPDGSSQAATDDSPRQDAPATEKESRGFFSRFRKRKPEQQTSEQA